MSTVFESRFDKLNSENKNVIVRQINLLFYMQSRLYSFYYKRIIMTIPLSKIMYFERDDRLILIKTITNESYAIADSIIKIEKKTPYCFICVNQSVCVDLFYVKSVNMNSVVMVDGREFDLSRKYKIEFVKRYNAFTNRKGVDEI